MNNAIIITPEQLGEVLERAMLGALEKFKANSQDRDSRKELPENLSVEQAMQYLAEIGCPAAKGQIYNLTHRGEIPCYRYGSRLIFKRSELLKWAESRIQSKTGSSEAIAAVARNARKHQR